MKQPKPFMLGLVAILLGGVVLAGCSKEAEEPAPPPAKPPTDTTSKTSAPGMLGEPSINPDFKQQGKK